MRSERREPNPSPLGFGLQCNPTLQTDLREKLLKLTQPLLIQETFCLLFFTCTLASMPVRGSRLKSMSMSALFLWQSQAQSHSQTQTGLRNRDYLVFLSDADIYACTDEQNRMRISLAVYSVCCPPERLKDLSSLLCFFLFSDCTR